MTYVEIVVDEAWPVYSFWRAVEGGCTPDKTHCAACKCIDAPEVDVREWERVLREYKQMQQEMAHHYELPKWNAENGPAPFHNID